MRPKTLGVIGLGAIGGSIAWQARRAGIPRIVGFAATPKDGVAAVRAGAVTELAHDAAGVARAADFLVLAAQPKATLDLLAELVDVITERDGFCTDVTSVKTAVVRHAERLKLADHFAGSHPFTGTHRTGFAAALPDRFTGAVVYVTPIARGDRAASEVADFWKRVLGAQPVTISAEQHDELLAWTSHLPQAVASALAVALATRGPQGSTYGTGARSMTRLAESSVATWTDVLLLNRPRVLESLEAFGACVDDLKRVLDSGNSSALRRWLDDGARWRARLE